MSRPGSIAAAAALVLGAALLSGAGCASIFGLDDTHLEDDDDDGGADDSGTPIDGPLTDAGALDDAPPAPCDPGDTETCYSGPDGTQNQGECRAGLRSCVDGFFGPCEGDITPIGEICNNGDDDDCNGAIDEIGGPGTIDFPDNGVDDDCDGTEDNVVPSCDEGLPSNSTTITDYGRAMGTCTFTTEDSLAWGVIDATLTFADGTGAPNLAQHAIRPDFGMTVRREGTAMLVLSTGTAAAPGQTDPAHVAFESGSQFVTMSPVPADWLAANGGVQPTAPGCMPIGVVANDPVMLTLRMRVPTNARAFRMRTDFFTTDYPEWMCTQYNDEFVVLLDSTSTANPVDKNLAFVTADGGSTLPMNANITMAGDFFRVCQDIPPTCPLNPPISTFYMGCVDDQELIGTGFDFLATSQCGATVVQAGAGTGWMITQGNVVGGEIITLRLGIWDNSDQAFDSLALIDAFEWLPEAVVPGTIPDL